MSGTSATPGYGLMPPPKGWVLTGMGAPTAILVAVTITDTVLSLKLATWARWTVGATPTPVDLLPTVMGGL